MGDEHDVRLRGRLDRGERAAVPRRQDAFHRLRPLGRAVVALAAQVGDRPQPQPLGEVVALRVEHEGVAVAHPAGEVSDLPHEVVAVLRVVVDEEARQAVADDVDDRIPLEEAEHHDARPPVVPDHQLADHHQRVAEAGMPPEDEERPGRGSGESRTTIFSPSSAIAVHESTRSHARRRA